MDWEYGIKDKWNWKWGTVQELEAGMIEEQFAVWRLELKGNDMQYRV